MKDYYKIIQEIVDYKRFSLSDTCSRERYLLPKRVIKMKMIKFVAALLWVPVAVQAIDLPSKNYFEKFCFDCHADGVDKGGIDFDILLKKGSEEKWTKVWEVIEREQMPPADKKKQPTQNQRESMLKGIEASVFKIDRAKTYPRSIPIYRLSNSQFKNSLYQIFGYRGEATMMLPTDATSMGFNNIASNMNISPLHFESYRNVALIVSRDIFDKKSRNSIAKKKGDKFLKIIGEGKPEELNKFLKITLKQVFRRPATKNELVAFTTLFNKVKAVKGVRTAAMETVRSMIISPGHIFRTELFGTANQKNGHLEVDEYALASRLSFLLWNSPPNEQLLSAASKNELRKNLKEILRLMLKDPLFENFSAEFGTQWLHIQKIESKERSNRIRPVVRAMRQETTKFITYLFKENRPLTDTFTSRVSFINNTLAEYYGMPKKKDSFHKVEFPEDSHRVGLLAHPSIHYATSNPDRTSPVKRGLWILESIIGMPPPPAPANVPAIEEAKKKNEGKKLTHTELLALHREDKRCASCHEMMDPLGLAMENFGKLGKWREEADGEKIVLDEKWRGHSIKSFKDLQNLLANEYRLKFTKCLIEKLLIYSISRSLDIRDQLEVKKIAENLKSDKTTFQDVLVAVINSTPFQYRLTGDSHDK